MLIVDDEGMSMGFATGNMGMAFRQILMAMFNHITVMLWLPDSQADKESGQSQQAQSNEGCGHSPIRPDPPGQRISDQPAGVGQGELCSKQRRPILSTR